MATIISRIVIKRFRSVRYLELEPASLCALIGPNNAGKTNILRAVNLVLGRGAPLSLSGHDYSDGDTSRPVMVDVLFAQPVSVGEDIKISGLRYISPAFNGGESPPAPSLLPLDHDGQALGKESDAARISLAARRQIPFILIDARRSFNSGDFEGQWASLRSLMEQLGGVDGEARSLLEIGDQTASGPGQRGRLLVDALRNLRHAAVSGAVIAVEEPEIFLHPHRERYFYRILRDLSGRGHQIIYATHSSNFVDIQHPEDVYLVRRQRGKGTVVRHKFKSRWSGEDRFMLLREFDASRNDLFFARGAMLVEGDTERFLFPEFLRRQGIDIDEAEISVVSAEGKGNLPLLIEVTEFFDIPYVVIFDSDMRAAQRRNSQALLKRLQRDGGANARILSACRHHDRLFIFEPNIESALGFNPQMKEKVISAMQYIAGNIPRQAKRRLLEPADMLLTQIRMSELE